MLRNHQNNPFLTLTIHFWPRLTLELFFCPYCPFCPFLSIWFIAQVNTIFYLQSTVDSRYSGILAANFHLNSRFFSNYQNWVYEVKIIANSGKPRYSGLFKSSTISRVDCIWILRTPMSVKNSWNHIGH